MLKKVPHVRNIISQSAILVKRFEEKLGPCVCVGGCVRAGARLFSIHFRLGGTIGPPVLLPLNLCSPFTSNFTISRRQFKAYAAESCSRY